MCGIAGQIGYERNMRQMSAVMAQMSAAIAPRGPDASGIYVDNNAYLVHRRLAVIDPDNGSQPMSSRGFTLVYNGELYNTQELRRGLEQRGSSCDCPCSLSTMWKAAVPAARIPLRQRLK